jgi:hypothetical protein
MQSSQFETTASLLRRFSTAMLSVPLALLVGACYGGSEMDELPEATETESVGSIESAWVSPPRIDGYCLLLRPAAWMQGRHSCVETPYPYVPKYEYLLPNEYRVLVRDPLYPGDLTGSTVAFCHYRANYPQMPYIEFHEPICYKTPGPPPPPLPDPRPLPEEQ